jgi:hypothetical protein
MENNEYWISILEYAAIKKISISTIRRNIKSKKLTAKKIDGKYFILSDTEIKSVESPSKNIQLELENQRLQMLLSQKEEEINDLQMLINIYEGTKNNFKELPELPLA